MREHFRTGTQVLEAAWDEEKQALKMVPAESTEFAMELSSADGDSVTAIRASATMTEGILECSNMAMVCLFGDGVVSISPDDAGEEWHVLALTALTPVTICARRIKLVGTGKLVLNG